LHPQPSDRFISYPANEGVASIDQPDERPSAHGWDGKHRVQNLKLLSVRAIESGALMSSKDFSHPQIDSGDAEKKLFPFENISAMILANLLHVVR
jgi:hypothetical protein